MFDLEIKYRLDEFLTNYDPNKDPGLPGWARFRRLVGDTQTALVAGGLLAVGLCVRLLVSRWSSPPSTLDA